MGAPRPSAPLAGPLRLGQKQLDEQALLRELWQISHFGWMPEAAIRRSLTIAGGQEISPSAVAERLQRLQERGWVEQRESDAATHQHEWRLTDSGRSAR